MKLFIFDRSLKLGLLILTGLAVLLWLTPVFPLPEGHGWDLLGQKAVDDGALQRGGLTPAEFDQQARNQLDKLHLLFVGQAPSQLPEELPEGLAAEPVLPEEVFSPFHRLCGRKKKSLVFIDGNGQKGQAWRAALLYSLNDCPATWLEGGLEAYSHWRARRGQRSKFQPSLRPPGAVLPAPPVNTPSSPQDPQ